MKVMPVAGKNPSNEAVAFATNASAQVITERAWFNDATKIYDGTPTTTSAVRADPDHIDVSGCGAVSLRIVNSTNKNITLGLYSDETKSSTHIVMYDSDNNPVQLTLGNKPRYIVTPDDWAALNWLQSLKLYFTVNEVPEGGSIQIYMLQKR